jgi:ribose transport system substrate-binding protein
MGRSLRTQLLAMAAFVALLAIAITGCGGSSDSSSSSSSSETATSAGGGSESTASLVQAEPSWRTGTPDARKAAFGEADNGKKVSIALFQAAVANPFWAQTTAAIEEVAGARNASVEVFDANFEPTKQQSQMQDAIVSNRFDAFVVVPVANTNLTPVVAQAKAKGIPVVVTGDFPVGPSFETTKPQVPGVVGVAETTGKAEAEDSANATIEACQGINPCEVAQISGGFALPVEAFIWEYMQSRFAEEPNIKVVAREEGGYLLAPARAAMQNILTAHPGLDVLTSTSDAMTTGAMLAAKQANKQVKLVGLAASQEGIEYVRGGEFFATTLQLPYDDGLYAADMALRAARGQKIEENAIDPVEQSGIPRVLTKASLEEVPDFDGQWKNG